MVDEPEPVIPPATYVEAAIISCPEEDCPWTVTVPWTDVDVDTGTTSHRPEYLDHYRVRHQTKLMGTIERGSVLVFSGVPDEGAVEGLMVELTRAAGHSEFSVLMGFGDPDEALSMVGPAEMAARGWVRAS